MNKYFLLVSLFLSTSFFVSAAPKQKKADTWIDASIKSKNGTANPASENRNADYFLFQEA